MEQFATLESTLHQEELKGSLSPELVNVTGFLGGGMTFGPYHMHPPL